MNTFYSKLKKVPALSKEELFLYVFENNPNTVIQIVSHAGLSYSGCIVNIGITRDDGKIIALHLTDGKGNFAERILHIAINRIESVELNNKKEIINILSKGKVTEGEQYEVSGKLEVKREAQQFSDNILKIYGVNIGVPEITLSDDGFELNRILKLTRIIQQVVSDLLKEEDALASWKIKYNTLVFSNSEMIDVKGINKALHIYFPFNDLNAPLIDQKELTEKLMSVL